MGTIHNSKKKMKLIYSIIVGMIINLFPLLSHAFVAKTHRLNFGRLSRSVVATEAALGIHLAKGNSDDDDKTFANILRECRVDERYKAELLRNVTTPLIGAAVDFVYDPCGDCTGSFQLFCTDGRVLTIGWWKFDEIYEASIGSWDESDRIETEQIIRDLEKTYDSCCNSTKWHALRGYKIRSVYLGCVNTFWTFGSSEQEKVRYFNEIYFDLGEYWVVVSAGIDDTEAELLTEKPDMNLLLRCAP